MARKKKIKSALIQELVDNDIYSVDAGWRVFPLVFVPVLFSDKGERLDGLTSFSPCLIQVHEDQIEEGIRESIIHEMFHVIASTMGLDPDEKDEFETTNEYIVIQLSRGSMLFQRLNPKLWDILFRNEENDKSTSITKKSR